MLFFYFDSMVEQAPIQSQSGNCEAQLMVDHLTCFMVTLQSTEDNFNFS